MIDPALLTEEAGFVEGVVVQLEYTDYTKQRFNQVGRLHIETTGELWLDWWDDESIDCSDIISINPLTGPMAIWNFAMKKHTHCIHYNDGDFLFMEVDHGFSSCPVSVRPWWAQC